MKKVSKILVVGAGCDGLLAAVNLKAKLPELDVRVVAHPLGDDAGFDEIRTTPAFGAHLHGNLAVHPLAFLRAVRPTWSLGTRYHWGPREFFDWTWGFQLDTQYARLSRETGFYVGEGARAFEAVGGASALMSQGRVFFRGKDGAPQIALATLGYHLQPQALLGLLSEMAAKLGVIVSEGKVAEAVGGQEGIAQIRLEGGEVLMADLYIDATGSRSRLLGQAPAPRFRSFAPSLACDRVILGSWTRTNEPIQPHTSVRTSEAGWCWRSDHQRVIVCGHNYSSAHLNDDRAEAVLRGMYPNSGPMRMLKIAQGRYENSWVGNVVGIGNAGGFVEPLAAAGPGVLAFACQWLAQTLVDCDRILRPTLIRQFNKRWIRLVEGEREFLGLFYRFNDRAGPFWSDARANAHVGDLEIVIRSFQDIGPNSAHRFTLLHEEDPIGMEGYFSVLVGQKVAYRKLWSPSAQELADWELVQDAWRRRAAAGFTAEEALAGLLGAAPAGGTQPMRRAMEPVA